MGKFPSASAHVRLGQRQLHWSSVMPRQSALSDQWGYPSRPLIIFFPGSRGQEHGAGRGSMSVSGPLQAPGIETKEDSCRCLNRTAHMKGLTDTRTAVCWH